MEFCTKCGALLPDNATVCPACGEAAHAAPAPTLVTDPAADPGTAAPLNDAPAAPETQAQAEAQTQPPAQPEAAPAEPAQPAQPQLAPTPIYAREFGGAPPRAPEPPYQNTAAAPPPQPNYAPQPGYAAPPQCALSTGEYLLTLFLFKLPLVGLILEIIWSFSSSESPARRNLSRASLILSLIGVAVAVVMCVLFFSIAMAAFNSSYYYSYF